MHTQLLYDARSKKEDERQAELDGLLADIFKLKMAIEEWEK